LYSISNIKRQIKSRRIKWAGHVARMGEERKVYMVLVGKPEGKKTLGRTRRRWKNGIKMDLRETGWGCRVDPVGSGWGSVAGSCKYSDEPAGQSGTELVTFD
jgi:hypothetical protein